MNITHSGRGKALSGDGCGNGDGWGNGTGLGWGDGAGCGFAHMLADSIDNRTFYGQGQQIGGDDDGGGSDE